MRAFCHFRSRDYGGRTNQAENPMLRATFMAVLFKEPELLPIELVSHGGNNNFRRFLLL